MRYASAPILHIPTTFQHISTVSKLTPIIFRIKSTISRLLIRAVRVEIHDTAPFIRLDAILLSTTHSNAERLSQSIPKHLRRNPI